MRPRALRSGFAGAYGWLMAVSPTIARIARLFCRGNAASNTLVIFCRLPRMIAEPSPLECWRTPSGYGGESDFGFSEFPRGDRTHAHAAHYRHGDVRQQSVGLRPAVRKTSHHS